MSHFRLRLCIVAGALFALVGVANAFAANVVVSEFRVRGPQGGNDELIELYNTTSAPIDISGWKVKGSNNAGTNSARATIPAGRILGAGCHYLLTNTAASGYSGAVPGDQNYTTGVTDDGGIALTLVDDTIVDQVGMSAGSAFGEGLRLTSLGASNLDRGYERKPGGAAGNAQDTNDNTADFSVVTPSNPQNQLSPCIPPAVATNPSGSGSAAPASVEAGAATLLTVTVTPGANPTSTELTVTGDLSSIGGSATQGLVDNGTNGDATAGDNIFSYSATVAAATPPGAKSLPVSIADAQSRSGSTSIALTVNAPSKPPSLGTPLVLNEFRTRGPAAGNDEFVELYNASSSTIAIGGMKISGSNNAGTTSVRATVPAGRVLGAGCYYLFTNSGAYSGTAAGDQAYTTGITDDGGVALMAADNTILDQVGLSTGSAYGEGARLAPLTTSVDRSYGRDPAGYDTNDNLNDFVLVSPSTPQNNAACGAVLSATGAASPSSVPVGGSTLLTVSVTPGTNPASTGIAVSADLSSIGGSAAQAFADNGSGGDATAGDNVFSYTATVQAGTTLGAKNLPASVSDAEGRSASASISLTVEEAATALAIHTIQGAAHISPRLGELVETHGIVTGKIGSSFYIQDPEPDADEATSEGIQIFGATATNTVSVGEFVTVRGRVSEFRASASAPNPNLSITELTSPTILSKPPTILAIAPTVIGNGGRTQPTTVIEDDASDGNVETSGVFDPEKDGLDFYESLEGMLVQMNDLVSTSYTFTSFGEIWVVGDNGANATVMSPRGALVISPGDLNPERMVIDDEMFKASGARMPIVNTGAPMPGPHVGIMDWAFGEYRIQLRAAPVATNMGVSVRESAVAAGANMVSIATFNVENLAGNEPDAKYNTLAGMIVNNLAAPDIVGLEEIQDNDGATGGTSSPVVDASVTLNRLVAAIQGAGGPTYAYRQINPVAHQDGGEPGGNIRVGFLFRTDRGLAFVDRPGGDSTTAVSVVSGPEGPQLSASPGRIEPTDEAWTSSRKPLAAEFTYNGHKLFVIVNHFNSKGGDQGLFGPWQPPVLSSEVQRNKQATLVAGFVGDLLAADPTANIAVIGDLNDFQFSPPVEKLKAAGLTAMIETLPANQRYSYVFDGNGQALDHIMLSHNLVDHADAAAGYDIVHVNAEFLDQASDHDPQLVQLTMPTPTITASTSPAPNAAGWNKTAVTVSFTCVDPLSALVGSCPAPVTLSSEGENQSVSRSVTTEGGSSLSAGDPDIDIDLTNPTVTYTGGHATYDVDETISITCTPSDTLSGIASSTCANISGSAASFALGVNTRSASALDLAGNTGTGSVSFTVIVTYDGLCRLTRSYVDDADVADSLCAKLAAAKAAAARGNDKVKNSNISAYVKLVKAQAGKSLTTAEAAKLTDLAQAL